MQQVPSLLYLPPTTESGAQAKAYDARQYAARVAPPSHRRGPAPELIAEFVQKHSPLEIQMPAALKCAAVLCALGALLVGGTAAEAVGAHRLAYSPVVLSLLSIVRPVVSRRAEEAQVFVLLMMSGLMWVRIRGAAYVAKGADRIEYYTSNTSTQLGIEAQIVACLNGTAALAMIALGGKIPAISSPAVRRAAVFFAMAALVLAFSAELALFRRKFSGYPYRLLFP